MLFTYFCTRNFNNHINRIVKMSKVIKGIQVPQRADFVGSFLRRQNLSDSPEGVQIEVTE